MSTKTLQGQLWSIAPQYWSKHFEPYFLPIYRKTLEQLRLTEDTLLLDAGCGAGLFTYMASTAGAQVIGVDAAPGLLEIARLRNPRTNFLEEDLEHLPFSDDSFHVVTGFNSFQYADRFENALLEAKRVLKKHGRLVLAIWGKPESSDATQILNAINGLMPPPPAGTAGPFALSQDGVLEDICHNAGLRMIYKTTVSCPMLFHTVNDAVRSFMGTGPAAAALKYEDRNIVEQTIGEAFEPFRQTEALHFLQNQFLLFILEK